MKFSCFSTIKFHRTDIDADERMQSNFDLNQKGVLMLRENSLELRHRFPSHFLRSIQLMTGLMSLQIESSNSALIQLFQNWWLQNCVLAAQDRLIGAYLHRAVYGIKLW